VIITAELRHGVVRSFNVGLSSAKQILYRKNCIQSIQCCISRRSKAANIKCLNYKHETNALANTFKAGSWQI